MAQSSMLFFSFFKSLADQSPPARVVLELKNGVKLAGTLEQVDEQLNFHLSEIRTLKPEVTLQEA